MPNPTHTETLDLIQPATPEPAVDSGTDVVAGPVRFEPCTRFDPVPDDPLVCSCGWLDTDHGQLADARRRRSRRGTPVAVPRAS